MNSASGTASFLIDVVYNYEVIATAAFDPISGGTHNPDGSIDDAMAAAKEAERRKKEYEEYNRRIREDQERWEREHKGKPYPARG